MSREKQIEEMAKILAEDCGSCDKCMSLGATTDGIDCTDYYYARKLYNAGYRKQSEGEWICTVSTDLKCSVCGYTIDGRYFVNMLNYCPECGAKMKGGE